MVSVITTILNEVSNVGNFIETLLQQSVEPDEIIICDGGSWDGTLDIVRSMASEHSNIKVLVMPGANRSAGRNAAIVLANSEIVVCVDAGCSFTPDWLEKLLEPLSDECVSLAFGLCDAQVGNVFQECLSVFGAPRPEDIDSSTFLPSSRSIAFRKEYWKKAGGYPEQYCKNEDTPFDIALKKTGCRFALAKDAHFLWEPRRDFRELFRQQYSYAQGDGEARLFFPVYWKTSAFYFSVLLLTGIALVQKNYFFLLMPFLVFTGYHGRYFYRGVIRLNKKNIFWPMFEVITAMDAGNVFGFWKGYIRSIMHKGSFHIVKEQA